MLNMSSIKHYMNNKPINVYNLYKYMVNLYKLGIIPEFNVHFNGNLSEIIFVTEYNNPKWDIQGTSIIVYNIEFETWRGCINTQNLTELCNKYPYLFEKNLFVENTNIIEEYITMQSPDINDILEPCLNPFENQYKSVYCHNYDLRNLYIANTDKIHNIIFSNYHGFLNNVINRKNFLDFKKNNENHNNHYNNYIYLNYNDFMSLYL